MSSFAASLGILDQTPAAQHATQRVAEFAHTLPPAHLPKSVRHEAARSFVNFIGCALGGSPHESAERAQRALADSAGRAAASVVGRAERYDVLTAALLNGMSASAHGF